MNPQHQHQHHPQQHPPAPKPEALLWPPVPDWLSGLVMAAAVVLLIMLGAGLDAHAQQQQQHAATSGSYYAGIAAGAGTNGTSTAARYNTATMASSQATAGAAVAGFVGQRLGPWWQAEAGLAVLPAYHGSAATSDYPAYKGLPAGTYPQTAAITQTIEPAMLYARGAWSSSGSGGGGSAPYVFAGIGLVGTRNRESGHYNGTDRVHFSEVRYRAAPLYGVGLQLVDRGGGQFVRIEATRIPGAVAGPHTGRRDVTMLTVAVGWALP